MLSCLLFASILACPSLFAMDISRHMSGSWYNPAQDGHGFSIEILANNRSVFYWYVYNPDGTPTFLIALGDIYGDTIQGTAYFNTGMRWGDFDPTPRTQTVWGDLRITFHDCNSATLYYEATHSDTSIPHGSGEISLVRLANVERLQCAANAHAGIYRGHARLDEHTSADTTLLFSAGNRFAGLIEGNFIVAGDYVGEGSGWMAQEARAYALTTPQMFRSNLYSGGQLRSEYGLRASLDIDAAVMGGSMELYAVDRLYRRGLDPSQFWGNYGGSEVVSGSAVSIDFDIHGGINGWYTEGVCSFGGSYAIPDPNFNLMDVSLTFSSCTAELDGATLTGLGYQADFQGLGSQDAFWLFLDDDSQPIVLYLHKTP